LSCVFDCESVIDQSDTKETKVNQVQDQVVVNASLTKAAETFPLSFTRLWGARSVAIVERSYHNGTLLFTCQLPYGPQQPASSILGDYGYGILCVCVANGLAWRLPLQHLPGFAALHPSLIMQPISNALIGIPRRGLDDATTKLLLYRYPRPEARPFIAIEQHGRHHYALVSLNAFVLSLAYLYLNVMFII
jgi:hypothetical protein